ncbi:SH3 domain-containing protein [Cognatiyoonia koreensis]|uniref:SH3 domain-containing protein n=1 Tax=Cognatiyoonia koreensis TaxID=364200 RepID=A0A1I0RYA8_9RHOB|nr:SH3 domain-containing protein [Cognatiyoonia koreensis]SEW46495.1 SH3 domain-containing protein [Cognatiyoonia koreensis]
MGKLIVGTFLILGLAFYELSGGSDFVPESRITQVATAEVIEEAPAPEVTRASNATLVNVAAEPEPTPVPEAEILQAVAEVVEEEAEPAPAPVEIAVTEPEPLDLRLVGSSRVNMRAGPGTTYAVLDTLDGGTQTEVIEVNADGWARVRISDTGQIGWMAERLLSDG